jgi:hypothetical protein
MRDGRVYRASELRGTPSDHAEPGEKEGERHRGASSCSDPGPMTLRRRGYIVDIAEVCLHDTRRARITWCRSMKTSLPRWIRPTLIILACGAACAQGPHTGRSRPFPDDIVRADLEAADVATAYEAVQRLRPRWLRNQGPASFQTPDLYPRVYVDGMPRGQLDELHRIPADDVETISFISAPDATMRWGTGHTGGVILVMTRRGKAILR